MSNYRIETKCVQSGYEPGNGEPRVLPIYQSTTFRYTSSEQMGRLFDPLNPLCQLPGDPKILICIILYIII